MLPLPRIFSYLVYPSYFTPHLVLVLYLQCLLPALICFPLFYSLLLPTLPLLLLQFCCCLLPF